MAANYGKPSVLRVLLDKGANIEAKDNVRDGYGDHVYSVGEGGRGGGGGDGLRWKGKERGERVKGRAKEGGRIEQPRE